MKTDCGRCAKNLRCQNIIRFGGSIYLCVKCKSHFNSAKYDSYRMRLILFAAARVTSRSLNNERVPCYYCREMISWKESTIDHVVPKSQLQHLKGSAEYLSWIKSMWNTVICCKECNKNKDDMSHNDFLKSEYIKESRTNNGTIREIYFL